ncbi:MAG TPA: response regulator [Candidatus Hypogeohydataceae bacterium YC38]
MVKKNILVVDDDPSIGTTLKGVLEDEGYNVVAVKDGLKAIDEIIAGPFSLVLMDIVMPGLSGVEAMEKIKEIRPTQVIIMTGHVHEENLVQEAKRWGARAVVYKPLQIPELLSLIEDVLAKEDPGLLVVDDDDSACKTLSGILEDAGYKVDAAQDGLKAIEMAKQSDYSLIFIDAKMPEVNGFQAMKEIKKIKPYIPVVMFTGYKIENFMERSRDCGARATMRKPFDVEDVLKLTEEILTKAQ